jgi:hypothetical protein
MDSFEELKKAWDDTKNKPGNQAPMGNAYLEELIRTRVRKEKRVVMEYFWASFTYQLVIYALMAHLVIRFWGEWQTMVVGAGGILLYVPFTWLQLRKFKAMARAPIGNAPLLNMQAHVRNQYELLSGFFRFKRVFDWVGLPVTAFLFVVFIFKLYVTGGIEQHPVGASLTYLLALGMLVVGIRRENRKSFVVPLGQLQSVLADMQTSEERSS